MSVTHSYVVRDPLTTLFPGVIKKIHSLTYTNINRAINENQMIIDMGDTIQQLSSSVRELTAQVKSMNHNLKRRCP